MKKNIVCLFLFLLLMNHQIMAEILTPDRRIEWTPGLPGEFPEKQNSVDIYEFGAAGDGLTDDSQAFTSAINSLNSTGGIVEIGEGSFLIEKTLGIGSGIVLRGAGHDKTHLLFDLGGASKDCINIIKYDRGNWINVVAGFSKGSDTVEVESSACFAPGDIVEIQQDNDPDVMYTDSKWKQSWAENAVGQLLKIKSIDGNKLVLNKGLSLDYRAELNPVIRTNGLVEYAGVERLHIKRLDAGDGHNISIKNAAYCRILEVESEYSYRSHVILTTAYKCEIRNNYFHHAHDYGGGGHGYGVDCITHSTGNLIENNVFQHLRHSMMAHVGSSGNVFAYNYSIEPNSGEGWTPCDISLHGHFANNNLFESNVVQEVDVADYWGPMGPGNTFLRNRIESEGLDVMDHSHYQNIIGNVLKKSRVNIYSSVKNILSHGNIVAGKIKWDPLIEDQNIPASYYLDTKPDFFKDKSWPLFGPDLETDEMLPAEERFTTGRPITLINDDIRGKPGRPDNAGLNVDVYPNPFNPVANISYDLKASARVRVNIYNIKGEKVITLVDERQPAGRRTVIWNAKDDNGFQLPSGIYFVRVVVNDFVSCKKMSLLK